MRYYGGKEKLLPFIGAAVEKVGLKRGALVGDLFSGTAVVARYLKEQGYTVVANDHLFFAMCLAKCRVELNSAPKFAGIAKIGDPLEYLNNLKVSPGFFSENYSPLGRDGRQYFTVENAMKIDAIRTQIDNWKQMGDVTDSESFFLLGALLEGMNRTSNVSGTYAAYLKTWDPRALKPLVLAPPSITPGNLDCFATCLDVNEVAQQFDFDLVYLDPPYNSRQYSSNYFLLDVVARGWFDEKPDVRGKTGMRDNTPFKSDFCSRSRASHAIDSLLARIHAEVILLSYSDEGVVQIPELQEILSKYGSVDTVEIGHKRYRAINQDGSKTTTTEFLFTLRKDS